MADGLRWIELAEGDEFAGYRIERVLGRGGMGFLYVAIEPKLERRVALKLIAPEAASEEVFSRRFAAESRIAASIEHPHVVPIYAAGEEGGVPFIAMRYVSGSDLGRRIAGEGRLRPAAAVRLIAQIASGLDSIHAAGLVHRDVKPANVLLSGAAGEDHAYITDFGVARNVAAETRFTQTGRFVGALDYVSPEQISGGRVDARADVYALGCLLFKLLTGEVPFPREGEAARLYAHLNDPPPAPSLQVAEIPMALDDVVVRAMSKEPADRYPSAGDLGRAATAALSGEQPTVPERTVATGAAATREASPPEPPTVEVATEASAAPAPARRFYAAALSVVAAAAAVALISGALGGEGGGPPAGVRPASQRASEPLSRGRLIAEADATCAKSQRDYKAIRDRESERSADVPYAEALVRFAQERIRGLRRLRPPPRLAAAYAEYVSAQERVLATDREALAAARGGDTAGVEAARDRRDAEASLRERLAMEIGFDVCSPPRS